MRYGVKCSKSDRILLFKMYLYDDIITFYISKNTLYLERVDHITMFDFK